MAIRQQTIDKYTEGVKTFISEVNKNHSLSATEFCRSHHLTKNFITHLISLGFITKTGEKNSSKYFSNLKVEDVQPRHGRLVVEKINSDLKKYRNKSVSGKQPVPVSLKDFTTSELVKELKSRGFEGELNRIETIKI